MKSLHASGWVKAPAAKVHAQISEWAVQGGDFLSHTEAAGRRDVLTGRDGFDLAQALGKGGRAECALMVAVMRWAVVSVEAVELSRQGIPRRGGQRPYALHVAVEDRLTGLRHHRIVVHLPSGVEGLRGLRRGAQARVWLDAVQTLAAYVAALDGPVIITADFNLNLRRAWVRALLSKHFPGFEHTPLPKRGGTHGRRFIDFSLARGIDITAARVVPNPASDHRALVERASIKEQSVTDDPYALTTHDGKRVDEITHQALLAAEEKLGYPLTIVQGSYSGGKVSASAGTHDGGGVVDLAPWDHERKVKVLRSIGFAAWYRPAIKGLWGSHIHAVLIGNQRLAPSASRQVQAYLAGRNGLKDDGPDDGPREFVTRRFLWPPPAPKPTLVECARVLLEEAIEHAGPGRKAAILAGLALLPKR